jgi:hypothetical protein
MEADHIACSTTISNVFYVKHFVNSLNLGIPNKLIKVFCDIMFTILLIKK